MAANRAKSSEVATAVNKLMRLDSADQEALLDVITDYFTNPNYDDDSDKSSGDETESDSDTEACRDCKYYQIKLK